jgi:outer membrane protein assembly factor BamB
MARRTSLIACLIASLASVQPLHAEDWPQFRGPNCSGVSISRNLPTRFSETENVVWQVTLGDGIGSPVIVGGKVFSTAMTGPKTFAVLCHDAASGKELWKRELETGPLPRITPPNSHAASTPAADGRRVYVYFSTLGLLAFDAATGKDAWRLPLPKPAYLMDWGAGSSPIIHNGAVLFCMDDDLNPYLLSVDAGSGKVRWKTPRLDMLAGYAVPVLCEAGGRIDVVVAGTGKLKGYDPADGKELWTCNTLLRTVMTTPVVKDGVIYSALQSYGDSGRTLKHALLEWLDTNRDGKLSRDEVPKEFHEKFDASDKNKDGFLDGDELEHAFQDKSNMVGGGNTIQAVRGGGRGDVTKTHLLWNVTRPLPSNLSSPLVTDSRLYVVKSGGLSSCLDAADGKLHWEKERLGNFGDYYASPVAADGKVFIAGRTGFVVVLADGPDLKRLAKNDMGGEIFATPAIADGRIFIRTREKLFCIAAKAR